jgi:hypothetical protein
MNARNWQRSLDRKRATAARAELRALAAHLAELKATRAQRFVPLSKPAQRELLARAVSQFTGKIRRCPTRGRK